MATNFFLLLLFVGGIWARPQRIGEEATSVQEDTCSACREVVGFVRRLLDTNEVSEVQRNLTDWCLSASKSAPRNVCSRYIEDGMNVLQRVGAESFCDRIGACASDYGLTHPVALYADSTSCDFCINAMTHIKGIVTDPQTEAELKRALDKTCDHCPVKDECVSVLDKNVDCLLRMVKEKLDPKKVCKSTGFCALTPQAELESYPSLVDIAGVLPASVPLTEIEPAVTVDSNGNPMNCLVCKQVAAWAVRKLKDNKTEEAIVQALDEVCDRIFSKAKQTECEAFVKQYTDEMIGILKETDDPKLICILIGVCAKGLIEDESRVGVGSAVVNCNTCLDGSRWVLDRIEDDSSDSRIEVALTDVCDSDSVPDHSRTTCKGFVSSRMHDVRSVLNETRSPNRICRKLQLCRPDWIETVDREVAAVQSLPSCFICKEIAKWVNRQVKQNRTEDSIEFALSSVCRFLRNVENCESKVADWSSRLIIVLKQASEPELACQLLQVCGAPDNMIETEDTEVTSVSSVSGSAACYECQSVTHFIQEELYSFDQEKRMEDFVIQNVCDRIPSDIGKETCDSFIKQYGSSIVQLIAMKAFDSKVVCEKELHICPKTVDVPVNPVTDMEVTSQNTCNLCITSVRELDSLLSSGDVDREISSLATHTCSRLPAQDQKQCVTLIEAFGPYFLQMVGRMNNPRQVCKELDICSDPGEVQVLGGHKCTYGPSYWCHTYAHAAACKADDYCRQIWEPIEQTE